MADIGEDIELAEWIVILAALGFAGYYIYKFFKFIGTSVVEGIDTVNEQKVAVSSEPCQKGTSSCDPKACNRPNYCTIGIFTGPV